jgi:hypothetical protein
VSDPRSDPPLLITKIDPDAPRGDALTPMALLLRQLLARRRKPPVDLLPRPSSEVVEQSQK